MLGANQLVGTDLAQAVPLTLAQRSARDLRSRRVLGDDVVIIGSVPAVLIGSFLSSRLRTGPHVRPVITFVISRPA
jgi:hypothetical protein